jgi:hypothetical protein
LCRVEMKIERIGQSLFHDGNIWFHPCLRRKIFLHAKQKNIQFLVHTKKIFPLLWQSEVDRVQNCKIFAPNRASQNPILNEFNDTRNESIRSNDTIVAVFYSFLRKYKSRIALVRARADWISYFPNDIST